ncbi:hypothetical protein V8E53_015220 [Lactarius tabidus]
MLIRAHIQEELQPYQPPCDWSGIWLINRVSARTIGVTKIHWGVTPTNGYHTNGRPNGFDGTSTCLEGKVVRRGLRVSLDPSEPPSVCTRSSLPFHFLNSPHFYFPKIPSLKQRSDDEAKAEEDDTNPHSDTKIFSTTHLTTYQGSILSQLSDFFATTKKTEHCRGLRVSLDPSEPPSVCTRSSLPFHFLNSPHFYFPKIPSLKQRSDDEAKAEEDDTNPHSDTKIFSTTHLTTYQGSILSQLSDFFATTKKTEHKGPYSTGFGLRVMG